MDRMSTLLLTFLSLVCIWLGSHPVEGKKCRGEWASHHACLGGNGKRADPSAEMTDSSSSRLLSKILGVNAAPSRDSTEYLDMGVDESDRPRSDYGDKMPDYRGEYTEGLENLLRRMIINLQRKQRNDE